MKNIYATVLLFFPFCLHAQFIYHQGFALGYSGDDQGQCIAVDQSGDVYVAGSFETYIDMDPGPNTVPLNGTGTDCFMAKYTSSGSLLWAKAIANSSYVSISGLTVDLSGNIYFSGIYDTTLDLGGGPLTVADGNFYVAKFDTDGQHIWSKGFNGTNSITVYCIDVSDDGAAIAMCGSFKDTLIVEGDTIISHATPGYSNAFVAVFDPLGNSSWAHGFGRTGYGFDRAFEVAFDTSGNVYVAGTFSGTMDVDPGTGSHLLTSTGSGEIFMIKYNNAGDLVNAFNIGGTTGELGTGIDIAPNGDFYLSGYSNSDSIDVDPDTGTAWLYGITGIIFGQDIIVAKYNANADYQWGFRIGRRASDTGWEIIVDDQGNLFVAGTTDDINVDFDPGVGTHFLSGDTLGLTTSSFLAHYTSGGNFVDAFLWQKSWIYDLALSGNGKVWIAGDFDLSSIDLDPGASAVTFQNAGLSDCMVAGYDYPYVAGGIEDLVNKDLIVFPVPAGNTVKIENGMGYEGEVNVCDITGKIVKRSLMKLDGSVSLEGLTPGAYFISARNDKMTFVVKVIKGK